MTREISGHARIGGLPQLGWAWKPDYWHPSCVDEPGARLTHCLEIRFFA
jgi:hypothetical protein